MRKLNLVLIKAKCLAAALFLTPLLTGCVTSNSAPVAISPALPPIPLDLDTECVDPGLQSISTVAGAVGAIGDSRLYAACNKRKHRDWKTFYKKVVVEYGKK